MKKRDLFLYHPGTGTIISLSDPVYLIDALSIPDEVLNEFQEGAADRNDADRCGFRIDNYNMTNLFFGED